MLVKVRSKDGPNLTPEQLARFFQAARQYKRKHPDWVMVEVQSADGDYVYVKL